MQYFVSVIDDVANSATPGEMEAIHAFNRGLQADGHWVFAAGLAAPESATVIDNRGGEPIFTDGPFVESKEFLAGFWVMEAPSPEGARRLATAASRACNRKVEVRPIFPAPAPAPAA